MIVAIVQGTIAFLLLGTVAERTTAFTPVNFGRSSFSPDASSSASSHHRPSQTRRSLSPLLTPSHTVFSETQMIFTTSLAAAASEGEGESGGGKKTRKRRKRKSQRPADTQSAAATTTSTTPQATQSIPSASKPIVVEDDSVVLSMDDFDAILEDEEIDVDMIRDIASFKFDGPDPTAAVDVSSSSSSSSSQGATKDDSGAIPLPDIKDTIRRKEMEAELARIKEDEQEKTKIDRSDRTALLKVRGFLLDFEFGLARPFTIE
jgi:hypothetical protein